MSPRRAEKRQWAVWLYQQQLLHQAVAAVYCQRWCQLVPVGVKRAALPTNSRGMIRELSNRSGCRFQFPCPRLQHFQTARPPCDSCQGSPLAPLGGKFRCTPLQLRCRCSPRSFPVHSHLVPDSAGESPQ